MTHNSHKHIVVEVDPLKIPAFMRKRSLAARDRSKLLITAFDRQQAGLLKEKKKKGRKVSANQEVMEFIKSKPRARKLSARKVKTRTVAAFAEPQVQVLEREEIVHKPAWTEPVFDQLTENELTVSKQRTFLQEIGVVTQYFSKIQVGVIRLEATMRRGDEIMIGKKQQVVESLQINRRDVKEAGEGEEVGLKLEMRPEVGEVVYKVIN